jgi:phage/conjugal plasmid C-4 type zinc finger TraR family protein
MAVGWARDGAVQDQIDASVADAVEKARSRLPSGASLSHCEDCGEAIPEARQKAIAGVRLCVTCQQLADEREARQGGVNRRASKDSQLR